MRVFVAEVGEEVFTKMAENCQVVADCGVTLADVNSPIAPLIAHAPN